MEFLQTTFAPKELEELNESAVEHFREYLKIPSVHPNVDYSECVRYLLEIARDFDLPAKVYEIHPKKPIIVVTWTGTDPSLPSILLNSHMDVVPVDQEKWRYPPFAAHMTEDGNIYGRGTQDMKSLGIQHLEAVRRLKLKNQKLKRTVHISFMPDEEIGGVHGMKSFVKSKEFEELKIGFALDEAFANPGEKFFVMYGEKSSWRVWVHCTGTAGHGSGLFDNTAGEKMSYVLKKFMDYRAQEKEKMKGDLMKMGFVTSINLTTVQGGMQDNVIPPEFKMGFDIRLPPNQDHQEFEELINQWCAEAGPGVFVKFTQKDPKSEVTVLDDTNQYWKAFERVFQKLGIELEIGILPGGTDARYVRDVGIPALCFSPINNTPILLHNHNEFLNKNVFLKGIEIYMLILMELGNF